jgi:hypothetical protein
MSRSRTGVFGRAFPRDSLRVAVAAAVALIMTVFPASASAGLGREAAETAASTLKSVEETAKAALPKALPPSPPAPVAQPAPPPRAPAESASTPRQGGSGSADRPAAAPPAQGIAGVARGAIGSVAGAGSEVAAEVATPRRDDGSALVAPSGRDPAADARRATIRGNGNHVGAPISVRVAEVAALRRWLARVWPAIALGADGSVGARVVGAVAGDLLQPAIAALTRLPLESPLAPSLSSVDSPLGGSSGPVTASEPSTASVPAPGEGGNLLYLLPIAGLLALLAFTVWREFDAALRPWQHRH